MNISFFETICIAGALWCLLIWAILHLERTVDADVMQGRRFFCTCTVGLVASAGLAKAAEYTSSLLDKFPQGLEVCFWIVLMLGMLATLIYYLKHSHLIAVSGGWLILVSIIPAGAFSLAIYNLVGLGRQSARATLLSMLFVFGTLFFLIPKIKQKGKD